jgi:hypothetical protein
MNDIIPYVENPEYNTAYVAMIAARSDLTNALDAFVNGNAVQDEVDAAFDKVVAAEATFHATPQFKIG